MPVNEGASNPQMTGLDLSLQFGLGEDPAVHPVNGQMFALALPSP